MKNLAHTKKQPQCSEGTCRETPGTSALPPTNGRGKSHSEEPSSGWCLGARVPAHPSARGMAHVTPWGHGDLASQQCPGDPSPSLCCCRSHRPPSLETKRPPALPWLPWQSRCEQRSTKRAIVILQLPSAACSLPQLCLSISFCFPAHLEAVSGSETIYKCHCSWKSTAKTPFSELYFLSLPGHAQTKTPPLPGASQNPGTPLLF